MKIQLTLLDDGPPFFFLGDPKQLVFSLTYQAPGPKDLEFDTLSLGDQKKILAHILAEHLECDQSYEVLYGEYQNIFSQSAPVEPEAKKPEEPAKEPAGAEKGATIPEGYVQQEEKFQKKCKKLVKKSLKALKKELENSNNPRILQTVRNLELKKASPRASVLNFIDIEVRELQQQIVESIENGAKSDTMKTRSPKKGETFVSDVIESEQEIVQLTPEMLIGQEAE